uniref:Uncharacterized protein n=1 Tax=Panagrolaimus sp. PS1159 TaxID=55785 RepID=A0AC35EZB4_9BILA
LDIEEYFDIKEYPEAKIVKNFKVLIGDWLTSVTLFKGKLETRMVRVLPFWKCENIWDPERLFILDREEQICTESVENRKSKRPQTIPSTLLFGKTEEHGFVFVGITSRTRAGVSVSTFLPFHCNFIFEAFQQELCI